MFKQVWRRKCRQSSTLYKSCKIRERSSGKTASDMDVDPKSNLSRTGHKSWTHFFDFEYRSIFKSRKFTVHTDVSTFEDFTRSSHIFYVKENSNSPAASYSKCHSYVSVSTFQNVNVITS